MSNFINTLSNKIFKNKFRPKEHRALSEEWLNFFREHGEGLYYCNLESKQNNIIAKAISKFSGGLSHTVAMLYTENIFDFLSLQDILKLNDALKNYYTDASLQNHIPLKVIVLASADADGMNFFNFSTYQNRKMSIRKPAISRENERKIISYFFSRSLKVYDVTGLVAFKLYKALSFFGFMDDPDADFCSEIVYDAFLEGDFSIAHLEDPSPEDIEKFNKSIIVHNTLSREY